MIGGVRCCRGVKYVAQRVRGVGHPVNRAGKSKGFLEHAPFKQRGEAQNDTAIVTMG